MKLWLYNTASTIDPNSGHTRTEFFCVGSQVHVSRTVKLPIEKPESILYHEGTWSEPELCDGRCMRFADQNLNIPTAVLVQIRQMQLLLRAPKEIFDMHWRNSEARQAYLERLKRESTP